MKNDDWHPADIIAGIRKKERRWRRYRVKQIWPSRYPASKHR